MGPGTARRRRAAGKKVRGWVASRLHATVQSDVQARERRPLVGTARRRRAAGKDLECGGGSPLGRDPAFSLIRTAAWYTPFAALRAAVPTGGRRSLGRRLVTAPLGDDAGRKFRVTHRFHPLYGREYVLLERGRYWGAERVMWEDERGEVRSLPASWTSAGEEDAFRVMSAGRSAFRVEDLLELVEVVRGVEGERSGGAGGVAGGVRGGLAVKGISSHE